MRIQETDRLLKDARTSRQKKKENVVEGPWLTQPRYAIVAALAGIVIATVGAVWFVIRRK